MGKIIEVSSKGDLDSVIARLNKLKSGSSWILPIFERYGQMGVNALTAATPTESGETGRSWYFTTGFTDGQYYLDFHNSHIEDGVPIAIILQYGHGTGTGGYVQGRDYINPALRPIFDQILADIKKEVDLA